MIDLKVGKLTHQGIGQMESYVCINLRGHSGALRVEGLVQSRKQDDPLRGRLIADGRHQQTMVAAAMSSGDRGPSPAPQPIGLQPPQGLRAPGDEKHRLAVPAGPYDTALASSSKRIRLAGAGRGRVGGGREVWRSRVRLAPSGPGSADDASRRQPGSGSAAPIRESLTPQMGLAIGVVRDRLFIGGEEVQP